MIVIIACFKKKKLIITKKKLKEIQRKQFKSKLGTKRLMF